MPPESMLEIMKTIFKARGYDILNTSGENRYLLVEKNGERRSVGYSTVDSSISEGEADMFLSMAMNDDAEDRLFAAPTKLPKNVRKLFDSENVAVWDRTNLSLAIGEAYLNDISGEEDDDIEKDDGGGSIFDLFQTEEPDPVKELRSYENEISDQGGEEEGFNLVKVRKERGTRKIPENGKKKKSTVKKLEKVPLERPDPEKKESKKESNQVPDEILLGNYKPPEKSEGPDRAKPKKEPVVHVSTKWSDYLVAPSRISREKALSISGSEGGSVSKSHRPNLLCWVRYMLDSGEGDPREGAYLVDLIDGRVTPVTDAVAGEIQKKSRVMEPGSQPEDPRTPKIEMEKARKMLVDTIGEEVESRERVVHDGMMSTIYMENRSRPKPESVEVRKNIKFLIPSWNGNGWSVDAYLGRLLGDGESEAVQKSLKK